jgi:hypothetical protein
MFKDERFEIQGNRVYGLRVPVDLASMKDPMQGPWM